MDDNKVTSLYEASGYHVFKRPVETTHPDGTRSLTMGFRVCQVDPELGEDAPPAVANMLSAAEVISEMQSAMDVIVCRQHQIVSGYDAAHDDTHVNGELLAAASTYITNSHFTIRNEMPHLASIPPASWPFEREAFHNNPDPVDDLIEAAAFILAEVDRLRRARGKEQPPATDPVQPLPSDPVPEAEPVPAGEEKELPT